MGGFDQALHTCALACALKRKSRECKNKWDSPVCDRCRFYVKKYINAEPSKVALYMMQTESEAEMHHWESKRHHPLFAAAVVVCLLIALFYYVKVDEIPARNAPPARTMTTEEKIQYALEKTASDLYRKKDVNKDGLVNCIDAAVLFYQYYPGEVYITWHKTKELNHLFNTVYLNGKWIGVEPQAAWNDYSDYLIEKVWGRKYNYKCNEDVTDKYKVYAKK